MTKKIFLRSSSVVLLVISIPIFLINYDGKTSSDIALTSLCVGVLGSVISIFIPSSYTYEFKNKEWTMDGTNGYIIKIKSSEHSMGNSPIAEVFMYNGKSYELVELETRHDNKGNVTIAANSIFSGKVKIT